jgi:hypothetical protein
MRKLRDLFNLIRTGILVVVILVVVLALLAFVSIKGWEYSNSNSFCANACHDVHPEEPVAFQVSHHASIKCVECHMGRTGTIPSIFKKAGHIKHLPAVIFNNYGRPVHSESMESSSESCERCHFPLSLHGDTLREVKYYLPDRSNTEKRLFFILRTGGREKDKGLTQGIHWHIINHVEYIAADEQKQDIRWVRVVKPDNRTVEYNYTIFPLSIEEVETSEKHVMDCLDCHNQSGHPFPTPEKTIDEALSDGRLSAQLPYIKRELTRLLTAEYETQEKALSAAQNFEKQYREKFPEFTHEMNKEIMKASELAQELVRQAVFKKPGVTWRSFYNNGGHKEFPGCFRCHDGKHVSNDGKSIPLECDLCHSIPVTAGKNGQSPKIPITSPPKPVSHREPKFISNHRILANEECTTCHGELSYSDDDSGFCASSACHGQSWEAFEPYDDSLHPFPLQARHVDALCYECHRGEEKPSDQCFNCHKPPRDHFAINCRDCHAPVGWSQSAADLVAQASEISHPLESMSDCIMCHDPSGMIVPAPADHQNYSVKQCALCH